MRRKARGRAQSAAQPRTRARCSTDRAAAEPTQAQENRCTVPQKDQAVFWKGPEHNCGAGENERLVFSIACSLAVAMVSFQRCLNTVISSLKDIITLKKGRLTPVLVCMSLAALVGASCGTLLLLWKLRAKNGSQVLLGQPAAELRSFRLTEAWDQSQEMQQLRDEVVHLAAEISTMMKEIRQMRRAMSATTQIPNWALKSAGSSIDLQRSSSSPSWLCRVFSFLCTSPHVDTFVQPDASPGYCWPFQGSQSEVLIRLPTQIEPVAITILHPSKISSQLGTASSAPRDFTVSGLDEKGNGCTLLGTFTYVMQKDPTQTFLLENGIPRAFRFLKLDIQSNWGKPGYTCIYRVQVYGRAVGMNAPTETGVDTSPRKN